MKDLTIIIPIIELNDTTTKQLFTSAVESAKGNAEKILVVGSADALKTVENADGLELLENKTNDFSYPSQVNYAVENVKTKYFSVLEFDDRYSPIWFKNVEKYINNDIENMFAYLPLTTVLDDATGREVGFANEAYWATSFSEEVGYLDLNSFMDYFNFNVSGAIFRTEDFKTLGELKPAIKLVFWYEFILRALYKGKKMYVIPKIGYIHRMGRPNSISERYNKEISDNEAEWWIELAKKDYFFLRQRDLSHYEYEE